jgi:ribonuclease E
VENRLRDALRQDRARVQFGTISKFGLMEMSRQRLRPALSEGASIPCPRCGGSGHIRDTESSALQILRIIQEESLKDNTASVMCQVPVDVASFLLNEKRTEIAKIELKQRINVLMVPNKTLETPNYKLERLKHDDPRLDHIEASYKMADDMEEATGVTRRSQEPTNKQTPVIKGVLPDLPAPIAPPKPEVAKPQAAAPVTRPPVAAPVAASGGFFGWIKSLFASEPAPAAKPVAAPVAKTEDKREGRGPRDNNRNGGRNEGRGPRGEPRNDQRNERRGEPRADGARPEGRNDRGENRGNRGGRGRGGEGRNGAQRERFDAEGKPGNVEALVNVDATPTEGSRSEARSERAPRGERNDRGDRGPRNGRGGERSGEPVAQATRNEARVDAPSQSETTAESNELPREPREGGRGNRGGRGRRNDRGPRQDEVGNGEVQQALPGIAEGNTADGEVSAAPEQAGENREPREKRSRDRYGRDRGPRQDRGERTADSSEQQQPLAQQDHSIPAQAPATPEAVPTALATPVPKAPPQAAAAAVAAGGMPKVSPYALPLDSLQQVASGSGLQWINTDAARVAAVQAAIAAEPKPVHVPRERPAPVVLDNRPLVLVETKRDLRNMTLPFEQDQAA